MLQVLLITDIRYCYTFTRCLRRIASFCSPVYCFRALAMYSSILCTISVEGDLHTRLKQYTWLHIGFIDAEARPLSCCGVNARKPLSVTAGGGCMIDC